MELQAKLANMEASAKKHADNLEKSISKEIEKARKERTDAANTVCCNVSLLPTDFLL